MRAKQKVHPNFSMVVMEVNKLSTHLGAYLTVHVHVHVNLHVHVNEAIVYQSASYRGI
jgi:hypothetical protein